MKNVKVNSIPWDNSLPVALLPKITEADCFGREYDPLSIDCFRCADFQICCLAFKRNNIKLIESIEVKEGGFLDVVNFEVIDKEDLWQTIQAGTTTTKQLFEHIKKESRCKDNSLVLQWIKIFMFEYDLISKEGVIWLKQ